MSNFSGKREREDFDFQRPRESIFAPAENIPSMKPRKPISRLTKLSILRALDRTLLRRLLAKFSDYLTSLGIALPPEEKKKRGGYNFKPLAAALLDEDNRPDDLVDALEAIGMLSDYHGVEVLHRVAKEFDEVDKLGSAKLDADFALKAYLDAPTVFYSALSDKRAVDTKRYRCFTLQSGFSAHTANLTDDNVKALEERFSKWFLSERRGKGCEIIAGADKADARWFVISHGGTKRRTPTFDDNKKDHAVFRPENGDVLRLRRRGREIWINSATASEADEYRKAFGLVLCGNESAFQRAKDYFDLDPLRKKGRRALEVAHIEGCPIVGIVLREIQLTTDKKNGGRWIVRANNDAFIEIDRVGGFPDTGEIYSAKFDVLFDGNPKPVAVKITLPAEASYERDGHSVWIDLWLENQKFIKARTTPDPLMEQPAPDQNVAIPA
jgi:hypothetical protein